MNDAPPECGTAIEGNIVAYPCYLPAGHDGPHVARENARSVRERAQWEEAQSQLAEFQGKAETTAERYTANPTPHPGVSASGGSGGAGDKQDDGAPGRYVMDERVTEEDIAQQPNMRRTTSEDFAPQPTKTRPGDQPLPQPSEMRGNVQDRIIEKLQLMVDRGMLPPAQAERIVAEMEQSKAVGIQRYGTALQTFNGRDTLQDAIDEARDLFVYLSALQQARDTTREEMIEIVIEAVHDAHQEMGGGAMTVEDIVGVAVDTLRHAMGI